jgi:hypothetical protein
VTRLAGPAVAAKGLLREQASVLFARRTRGILFLSVRQHEGQNEHEQRAAMAAQSSAYSHLHSLSVLPRSVREAKHSAQNSSMSITLDYFLLRFSAILARSGR